MPDVNELDAITGEVIIRHYTEEEKSKIEELKNIPEDIIKSGPIQ